MTGNRVTVLATLNVWLRPTNMAESGCVKQDVPAENLSQLFQRHKRERKELQAKIQSFKKSVTKGDKKKKKEVLDDITRLEAELEQRHTQEEANLVQNQSRIQDGTEVEELVDGLVDLNARGDCAKGTAPVSGIKVSKAQKRRDKKAFKDREREQQIVEQERENVLGARNVEAQEINALLRQRGLAVYDITPDGNCLYCAVEHQLTQQSNKKEWKELRRLVAEFLRDHPEDFMPFLCEAESGDPFSTDQFEEYCNQVANTAAWGGQLELRALSHVLKMPIEVIQADGPILVIGEEFKSNKKITLIYHRHAYGLGEHYNSVHLADLEEQEDS